MGKSAKKELKQASKLQKQKEMILNKTKQASKKAASKMEIKLLKAEKAVRKAEAKVADRDAKSKGKEASRIAKTTNIKLALAEKLENKARDARASAKQWEAKLQKAQASYDAAILIAQEKKNLIKSKEEKKRDAEKAELKAEKARAKADKMKDLANTKIELKEADKAA
jgi:hypothetical protein